MGSVKDIMTWNDDLCRSNEDLELTVAELNEKIQSIREVIERSAAELKGGADGAAVAGVLSSFASRCFGSENKKDSSAA
jgi:uncharacterized small protein (DUF1192 family)